MSGNMQKIMMVGVGVLVMMVIVLLLVIQTGDDGAVLISDDAGTLSIVGMVFITVTMIIAETVRSGNFATGYIKLIDRLTNDAGLQDAIELEYLAMPSGLHKDAINMFADLASAFVKMTPDKRDDKLAGWLQDALDGKIEMPE